MNNLATPARMIFAALALGLPLAAGLAVVAWSKVRAAAHAARGADVDARLRGLYRTVQLREPPAELIGILDTLEEQKTVQDAALAATATTKAPSRQSRQA